MFSRTVTLGQYIQGVTSAEVQQRTHLLNKNLNLTELYQPFYYYIYKTVLFLPEFLLEVHTTILYFGDSALFYQAHLELEMWMRCV